MKKKKQRLTDADICDAISQAIRQSGWSIPTDAASGAAAEERLTEHMPELPNRLKQPKHPSTSADPFIGTITPLWDSSPFAEPMARAARDGGSVPPGIEDIMKRDRKGAERELRDRLKDKRNDG